MATVPVNSTYSFLDVLATIAGPVASFSLGSGAGVAREGITITFNEDKNMLVTGADGKWMTSLRASRSGSAIVRLLKTSPTNALLNQMFNYETTSSAYSGNDIITITDPVRGDTTTLQGVSFKKAPDVVYSEDGNIMEWSFNAGRIDTVLGDGTPG